MDAGEKLLDAVRSGDISSMGQILDENPDSAVYRNSMGQSAVLLATYHRKHEALQFLLDRGVTLSLHEACATGKLERVQELLKEVPRLIDAHSPDGFTPLALAAFFGHGDTVVWLIGRGANLDLAATNAMKVSPLHAAAAGRHVEIVRMLVEAGASVNARQQGGFTPLHAAAQSGDIQIARLLLDHGADRTARADNHQSALDFALQRGDAAMVELLDG